MKPGTNPLDQIPKLIEAVTKAKEARQEALRIHDDFVEKAESDLRSAIKSVEGSLAEAKGAIGKKAGRGQTPRGELMALVKPLLERGMTVEAIAVELDRPAGNVKRAIERIQGGERPVTTPAAPARPAAPPPPDDDGDAPTVEKLREAIICNLKGSKAQLMTSLRAGHKHVAEVDRFGNGFTLAPKNGHVHGIRAFVVGAGPDGHRHDLTTEGA
jgi:hypothetical protein